MAYLMTWERNKQVTVAGYQNHTRKYKFRTIVSEVSSFVGIPESNIFENCKVNG